MRFRVVRPVQPEPAFAGGEPADYVRATALLKAREVAAAVTEPVLAADTAVVLGARVFGKPAGPDEAREMLRALSGRTHTVVTGLAAIDPGSGRERVGHDATRLTLRELTESEIDWYLATGEPMDKAGAYALQGEAARFVTRIDGERETVIGLPVAIAMGLIADLGAGSAGV